MAMMVAIPVHLATVPSASAAFLQCVIYARSVTGFELFGDAWTWWDQAKSRYERAQVPQAGSALIFKKTPKMRSGHVAVVREVRGEREIIVDHANWAPRGAGKGRLSKGVSIIDVSPKNDWTQVRVWYPPVNDYGSPYLTYGFVLPDMRNAAYRPDGPQS